MAATGPSIDDAFALLVRDETQGRRAFGGVLAGERGAGDADVRRLAAAGQLLAIASEFADFRGLDDALAAFDWAQRAQWPPAARARDQVRIDVALTVVPMLDDALASDDACVAAAADRAAAALASEPGLDADERVLLWKCLLDYRGQRMDVTSMARIVAQAQDHLRTQSVSPHWQARWWLVVALNHGYNGAAVSASDARERALELADRHDLIAVRYEVLCTEMVAALKADGWQRAEALAREIELAMPNIRAGRLPAGLRALAWWHLWRGEPKAALRCLDRLLAICDDAQVPQRDRGAYHVLRSYALHAMDRHDDAVATLQALRGQQKGEQGRTLDAIIGVACGVRDLKASRSDAADTVCAAMRACAALDFDLFLQGLHGLAAEIAAIALDAGVETEFVTRAVRTRRLAPPNPAREDWPWRLRVRLLGGLEVRRDGQPLVFGAKLPKKPLELLALLAAQGSRPLSQEAAIDALWPSVEAAAPQSSLEVALTRLRKLLELPHAVQLVDGGLRLDPRTVWSDVRAFEHCAERWQREARDENQAASGASRDGQEAASPAQSAAQWAGHCVQLYRGALRAGATLAAPWPLRREQLALTFERVVTGHGDALQRRARWHDAAAVYEQALVRDPLSEPIVRALMRSYLQLGERAQALRTFSRLRDLLASVLGTEPSHETLALRDEAAQRAA